MFIQLNSLYVHNFPLPILNVSSHFGFSVVSGTFSRDDRSVEIHPFVSRGNTFQSQAMVHCERNLRCSHAARRSQTFQKLSSNSGKIGLAPILRCRRFIREDHPVPQVMSNDDLRCILDAPPEGPVFGQQSVYQCTKMCWRFEENP